MQGYLFRFNSYLTCFLEKASHTRNKKWLAACYKRQEVLPSEH
ncbi:hypothetical protein PLUTE_a0793 [Pseudoalteromonas luteoviolacea DSM 6061]|nr:hypothetical protein [Pseudoalteromonas luteoviolacea DSM 6061]